MRNFSNVAVETELALLVDAVTPHITVKETTGHPAVPFTLLLDPDGNLEEIVLATARNGLTYDVVRGWGGTTAVEHAANAKVRHGAVAEDFREAALAYRLLYGTPVYNPNDPTAPPTNPPLLDPATVVTKTGDTWGDLL